MLWLGAVDTAAGPRAVMVQTAVAGRALSGALPGMSAGQRWSAARSCGQVIARLHSVRLGGFYLRHADGSFDFADGAALQAADLANRLDPRPGAVAGDQLPTETVVGYDKTGDIALPRSSTR